MDLIKYGMRLENHNWDYQSMENSAVWLDGHKEFETLIQLSFTTPKHRKLFLSYKKRMEETECH